MLAKDGTGCSLGAVSAFYNIEVIDISGLALS